MKRKSREPADEKGGISLNYLIKKARQGDTDAFVELMERQKQSMYKVARSYLHREEDIADAMQETVLDCYEKLGQLKSDRYFSTWLIRILINNCNDILRTGKKETPVERFQEQGDTCRELFQCEFEELMNTMDEKYRVILMLYYGEGFKIREIAQILDMDESTVKTRLARGRRQFAHLYQLEPAAERR